MKMAAFQIMWEVWQEWTRWNASSPVRWEFKSNQQNLNKIEKSGEIHPLQNRCRVSTYKKGNYMHNTMTKGRNWEGKDYCTSFSYMMFLNKSISAPIVPLSQIPKPAKSVPHISDVWNCRGKFGVVFHVKDRKTDRCYAAKHIRIRKAEQKEKVRQNGR